MSIYLKYFLAVLSALGTYFLCTWLFNEVSILLAVVIALAGLAASAQLAGMIEVRNFFKQ